eukprot:9053573-Alexandrium_andersonii.AAC.1
MWAPFGRSRATPTNVGVVPASILFPFRIRIALHPGEDAGRGPALPGEDAGCKGNRNHLREGPLSTGA